MIQLENSHTQYVEKLAHKKKKLLKSLLGIFYKMRYKLPDWCLHNIYFAFVHPYILYGLEVYGNTYASYLNKLIILNNKRLRNLQKKGHASCNESLYLQYNILPAVQLFNYQLLSLVHKMVYSPHLLPCIFWYYFTPTSSIHRYESRYRKLYLTHVTTLFGQRILRFKCSHLWNILANDLTNNIASQCFCEKLKLLLICDPM